MTDNPIRIVRAAPIRVSRPGSGNPVRVISRGEIEETRVRAIPVGLPGEPGDDGINGVDGREIEIRKTATHIEWRRTGEETWQQLIAIIDLAGAEGLNGGNF